MFFFRFQYEGEFDIDDDIKAHLNQNFIPIYISYLVLNILNSANLLSKIVLIHTITPFRGKTHGKINKYV